MSRWRASPIVALLLVAVLAGCLGGPGEDPQVPERRDPVDYQVPEADENLEIVELSALLPGAHPGIEIHVRVAKPDTQEPVGVIVEFTPYRLLDQRQAFIEPQVGPPGGTFMNEFVKRGFAFAWADARGTGDSSGCIDLRGSNDIADAYALTEWLGTQDWSNGKVGFIGASYPGSMAHIAGIANNKHLGGIVPVVASTSFYNYHHMAGVPYQNALGTTKGSYTAFALGPTVNAHNPEYAANQLDKNLCPEHVEHVVLRGALDQTGEYNAWWHDRNLQWRVDEVQVPVLMVQGLQDWNVKPNHIATYFNELNTSKTLVAPQMGHRYADIGDPDEDDEDGPFGWWWEFVSAFFDETLNGVHTGLFDEDRAYVQDTTEAWHIYEGEWPPQDAPLERFNLTEQGLSLSEASSGSVSWEADPVASQLPLAESLLTSYLGEDPMGLMDDHRVILESEELPQTLHTSGVPRLDLTIVPTASTVHLTAVLQYQEPGSDTWSRVNWGYLNPTYRNGLDDPTPVVAHESIPVTIDFHPQEDIFEQGGKLRLVLASTDGSGTVPSFDPGTVQVELGHEEHPAGLWLPLSPLSHG